MLDKSDSKKTRVEELDNFPFTCYDEFRNSIRRNEAIVSIDRSFSSGFASRGIYLSTKHRLVSVITMVISILMPIIIILYSIITGTWLLLLSLPLFYAGFALFRPSYTSIFRRLALLIDVFVFFVGIYSRCGWLIILASSLLIYYFSYYVFYKTPSKEIVKLAVKHEELLCDYWERNILSIYLKNIGSYWHDFKIENGITFSYKLKEWV